MAMEISTLAKKQHVVEEIKDNSPPASIADDKSDDTPSDGCSEAGSPVEQFVQDVDSAAVKHQKDVWELIEPRFWSAITLLALAVSAPIILLVTLVLVLVHHLRTRTEAVPFNGKVAIVTGGKMTKSFMMIKQLKAQGCRVVLVETHKYWMVASRFSKCVDRFVTVPVPEKDPEAFNAAMARIAEEEKADIFVPVTSPVASQYEAALHSVLPEACHSWSLPAKETEDLDDKVAFCQSAVAIGLPAPITIRVTSHAEVHAFNEQLRLQAQRELGLGAEGGRTTRRYILKNLQYDSMHRLDLFTLPCEPATLTAYLEPILIDESNPWTIQTFVVGDEYSTCAIVKDGRLLAYTDNKAELSCFNYTPARSPKLFDWVQRFCAARNLTGIVCIDFIVDAADGTPFAIECNPRASSNITNFYNHPGFGAVLVNPEAFSETITPLPSAVETYWLFSEAWSALTKKDLSGLPRRLLELLRTVVHKKDAYFDPADPMSFLALYTVHLPTLLLRNIYRGNRWAKIDPCIGKMTEENGD